MGPRMSANMLFTTAIFLVNSTLCVTSTPALQPARRSPVTVSSVASYSRTQAAQDPREDTWISGWVARVLLPW